MSFDTSALDTRARFWLPVKIGLGLFALVLLARFMFSSGPEYEAPLRDTSSPSSTYEVEPDEVVPTPTPAPVEEPKTTAELVGEQAGQTFNDLRDAGREFWTGFTSATE